MSGGSTKSPSLVKLAWMAGIFEGEGSAYVMGGRLPTVCIVNTDVSILKPFKIFGGTIQKGSVRRRMVHTWRAWRATCRKAELFAEAIYPFCRSPRSRAKLRRILNWYKEWRRVREWTAPIKCRFCGSTNKIRHGHKYRNSLVRQNFLCKDCGRFFSKPIPIAT